MDLKERFIAKLKSGKPYPVRNCSMCGYKMSYIAYGEDLVYDAGCDCVTYNDTQRRPWSDLDFYFEPSHGHLPTIQEWIEKKEQ